MYEEEVTRIAERILWLSFRYRKPLGVILGDCYAATGREWRNTQTELTGWLK